MNEEEAIRKDERTLAALAHGSILLGVLTNGVGGIGTALVIWLTQKEKSAYVAGQALQALVYQVAAFILAGLVWCCWGMAWMGMMLPPLIANPEAYETAPPAGMWVALVAMIIPVGICGLTGLYALWGAARCLGGHDFKYTVIGRWLESQK